MLKNIRIFLKACHALLLFSVLLTGCKSDNSSATTVEETKAGSGKAAVRTTDTEVKKEKREHLNTGGLEWMNMDQLAKIPLSGSKLYLIDIYTEWCGWCRVMDKKTFSDKNVQDFLRQNFHLIKFDAERKDPVVFKSEKYEWKAGGRKGNNELALELLDGKMSYPSLVYLDQNLKVIKVSSGYKNPQQLLQELEIVVRS